MIGDDVVIKIGDDLFATGRVCGKVRKRPPFVDNSTRGYAYGARQWIQSA